MKLTTTWHIARCLSLFNLFLLQSKYNLNNSLFSQTSLVINGGLITIKSK